jgi:hypothetical protein
MRRTPHVRLAGCAALLAEGFPGYKGDETERVELIEPVVDLALRVRTHAHVNFLCIGLGLNQAENLPVVRRQSGPGAFPSPESRFGKKISAAHSGLYYYRLEKSETRQLLATRQP